MLHQNPKRGERSQPTTSEPPQEWQHTRNQSTKATKSEHEQHQQSTLTTMRTKGECECEW